MYWGTTIVLAGVLLLGALGSSCATRQQPADGPIVPIRKEIMLNGRTSEFPRPGRVTLVDFWATWCKPCKPMMKQYEKLWREHKPEGLDVIGVASDDNPGLVAQHLRMLGVSYPNVVDERGFVRGAYRVKDLPHTMVIDRRGRTRLSVQGGKPEHVERVVAAVSEALEEEP